MAEYTTIKRSGGWCIELSTPIDGVDRLDIAPVSLDHTIRWSRGEIQSVLALLSELTGVSESRLKKLTGTDSDRVFVAFSFVAPAVIKSDFEKGVRPLSTPPELMTEEQRYEALDENKDPDDPRFPRVDGLVRKVRPEPVRPEPSSDDGDGGGGMNISPPSEIMKKVG